MRRWFSIFVLCATSHAQSTATVSCPAACTVTVTSTVTTTPVVTPPSASYVGPCDVLATAQTPCVAAYSLTRRMLAGYTGSLFQITRASDKTALGVGTLSSGIVNVPAITNFCASTSCSITIIYDQAGKSHLIPSCCGPNWPTGAIPTAVGWTTPPSGQTIPVARILNGEAYLYWNGAANGIPTGNSSITEYMVAENTSEGGQVSGCCGSFNDSENPIHQGSKGQMFGLAWSTGGMGVEGTGTGPWPAIDLELGVYGYGPTPTQKYLSILGRYNSGSMTLKSGDATQGSLTTLYSGSLPAGYTSLNLQGAVSLGMGGDGSNSPINFLEGAIVAGATTDATDSALQANVVGFY